MQKRRVDILVVAFALFAMFVGAGNIIFPIYLGAKSSQHYLLSSMSFICSSVGLPILAFIAVARAGGHADDIAKIISPGFAAFLNIIIITIIGPLFAIPRTAATTYELTVLPYVNNAGSNVLLRVIVATLFFIFCLYFVITPTKTVDKIGKFLTPVIIIFCTILIAVSFISGRVPEYENTINSVLGGSLNQSVAKSFALGYQTMDALAAIVFSGTIFLALKNKGYGGKVLQKNTLIVAGITAVFLLLLYLGLINIGHQYEDKLINLNEKTRITTEAVRLLLGDYGQFILAMIILFACTTTAIGLIVTAAGYFHNLLNKRIPYITIVAVIIILSFFMSIIGVEGIVNVAGPVLEIIYPIVISLVIVSFFGDILKKRWIYITVISITIPFSIMNILLGFKSLETFASDVLSLFPLGSIGIGFIAPLAVFLTTIYVIEKRRQYRNNKASR